MDQDVILTAEDAEFLRVNESGIRLAQEIKLMLNKCRLEIDVITPDRLPVIQGRITAFKSILTILGVDYE